MIGKFSISLETDGGCEVNGVGGEVFHALTVNVLGISDKKLSDLIHNQKELKPLSIFPSLEKKQSQNGKLEIKNGEIIRFEVSALNQGLLEKLLEGFSEGYERKISFPFSTANARIHKIHLSSSDGAQFTPYSDILKGSPPKKKIKIQILTPLSFRRKGRQIPYPLPEPFFNSLLKLWNKFSGIKLPEKIGSEFEKIKTARYFLRTELWKFSNYSIIGCKGSIEFNIAHLPESTAKMINALCRFAEFSGVGYKRTMGMGMVKIN